MSVTNNWDSRRVAIERHIAEGTDRIARFHVLMRDTASRGGDTRLAERLLVTMEATLTTLQMIRADNHYRSFDVERQRLHFHGVDAAAWASPPRSTAFGKPTRDHSGADTGRSSLELQQ